MSKLIFDWIKWSCCGKVGIILIYLLRFSFRRLSFREFWNIVEEKWNMPSVSLIKTIYLNLKCVDNIYAWTMPIFVYKGTQIISLKGKISFDGNITSKLVKLGWDHRYRSNGKTRLRVDGNVLFGGECVIGAASNIAVFDSATLKFGKDSAIWENCMIYCANNIEIGKNTRITFHTSIMDSDFHYMVNLTTRSITPRSKPIIIGNYVWIGNRANIKKGTIIPDYTTIASSNTLLSKDYSSIPPYSVLGGIPAKIISSGMARIWNNEIEYSRFLDSWFDEHGDQIKYTIGANENIENYIKS